MSFTTTQSCDLGHGAMVSYLTSEKSKKQRNLRGKKKAAGAEVGVRWVSAYSVKTGDCCYVVTSKTLSPWAGEMAQRLRAPDCSSRGPEFNSQQPIIYPFLFSLPHVIRDPG